MNTQETYMLRCLELAVKGLGSVAPNPMVGCVLVHENKIIGEGYHQKFGEAHAEVNAIHSVKNPDLLKESTLYVNLEPCSHFGNTPPCAELIISSEIKQVIIGCIDPNPLVKGSGIEKLVKAGIDVKVGVSEKKCRELNRRFFTFHEKKRPYIILKWAQTKDGFIDWERTNQEAPLQISGSEFMKLNHLWRSQEQAIMVGTNTVLKDNPRLTVREVKGKNPARIVPDRELKIPESFHVYDNTAETIIFTTKKNSKSGNIEFISIDFNNTISDQILTELHKKNISSILIEGGAGLLNSFLSEKSWDEARVYISANSIGKGIKGPSFSFNTNATTLTIDTGELFIFQNQY